MSSAWGSNNISVETCYKQYIYLVKWVNLCSRYAAIFNIVYEEQIAEVQMCFYAGHGAFLRLLFRVTLPVWDHFIRGCLKFESDGKNKCHKADLGFWVFSFSIKSALI